MNNNLGSYIFKRIINSCKDNTTMLELKNVLSIKNSDIFLKDLFIYRNNVIDIDEHEFVTTFMNKLNLHNSIFDKYKKYKNEKDIDIDELKKWFIKNDLNNFIKNFDNTIIDNMTTHNVKNKVFEFLIDANPATKKDSYLQAEEILVNYLKKKLHLKTIRQDEKQEIWCYNEGIYVKQGIFYIKEELRNILGRAFSQNITKKITDKIEADTGVEASHFFKNTYAYLLPLKNGILDINTLKLHAFTPDKIFFQKLPVSYNINAKCPKIQEHLKTVLKDESDVILLQEAIGNCLIKNYRFQKAVMLVGSGRNGKSVTLDLITRLLGTENCCSLSLDQIEDDQFALSELHGKLANISGDLSKTALKNTGNFKKVTGEDSLTAQRKFMTPLYFTNYAKFLFACNELPIIYDNSVGFWDRWLYFDFPYTFVKEENYDKNNKTHKLANNKIKYEIFTEDEMEGFLNFALEGLKRLLENNQFSSSKTFEEVKEKWITQSDSLRAFCNKEVDMDYENSMSISTEEFRRRYTIFCKDNKLKSFGDKYIYRFLTTEFGAERKQIKNNDFDGYRWLGIKWKEVVFQ